MTDSTPGLPTKGSNKPLLFASIALLVGAAFLVYLKFTATSEPEVVRPLIPPAPPEAEPELAFAPPPPPELKAEVTPAPEMQKKSAQRPSAQSEQEEPAPKEKSACSKSCTGSATTALKNSLRSRGAQAKACYQNALRQNAQLAGSLVVSVQVTEEGSACSASISKDTIGDGGVRSCILSRFRNGKYPAPQGGCVSINLPLNFSAR